MAVFRIERTRDYTVMSNHHLRNANLSLKAKGLLSMMLSLPEDWNYTTRGLAKICKEGVDAIGAALRELEAAGYIVRHKLRDRQGRISDTEYVIYEQPQLRKTARNKNVLVIGGSGSGKTRFWLKPNLMQMHSSYVVTDPKGTILVECGKMLQRGAPKLGKDGKPMKDKHGKVIYEPYRIKVLNTINFKKSMHYNPFAYIHSEKDILKLVTTLIANTKGEGKAGDDFWVSATRSQAVKSLRTVLVY